MVGLTNRFYKRETKMIEPNLKNIETAKRDVIGALTDLLLDPNAKTQDALTTSAAYFRLVSTANVTKVGNIPPAGWYVVGGHPGDWYTIRAEFDRVLTAQEIIEASGAIGYALRIYVAGEELSLPTLEVADAGKTVLVFGYDSTKTRRDDPNHEEAFDKARDYIVEGSPVRKTDRAGRGTAGTRLVAGIGAVGVTFYVR
jgi:hypothetical protein